MTEVAVVTSDTILDFLYESVSSKKILNPEVWYDAAFKLNVLLGDEHEKLEDQRRKVADLKLMAMESQEKRNVAAATLQVEATQDYRAMRLQEHKVDRIEEFIRLAKIQAKTAAGY